MSAPGFPPAAVSATMGLGQWASLILLSVLWGGSFFFIEVAVAEIPPLTLVALRVGLAALTLWAVVLITGVVIPRTPGVWGSFLIMGAINNAVPFSLLFWAQTEISGSLASILNASTPLFTVLVASMLLRDERATALKLAGVVVGFVGVAVMVGVDALDGLGDGILAQAAVLGAALSYAFAGVFGRRFKPLGVPPLITAAGQVTASTLLLVPVSLLVEAPWSVPMPGAWAVASVMGLALASTAFAYILYFRLLASAGATNLLLVTFLVPVSAILLGGLILGERLAWYHGLGMALIALGLSAIDGRLWRRRRPSPPYV